MYCKLLTACGCSKYLDLPEDLAHHHFRIPLPELKPYRPISNSIEMEELKIREFRYERYIYDEILHNNIPLLKEVLK